MSWSSMVQVAVAIIRVAALPSVDQGTMLLVLQNAAFLVGCMLMGPLVLWQRASAAIGPAVWFHHRADFSKRKCTRCSRCASRPVSVEKHRFELSRFTNKFPFGQGLFPSVYCSLGLLAKPILCNCPPKGRNARRRRLTSGLGSA
jgi:hypothetical protein